MFTSLTNRRSLSQKLMSGWWLLVGFAVLLWTANSANASLIVAEHSDQTTQISDSIDNIAVWFESGLKSDGCGAGPATTTSTEAPIQFPLPEERRSVLPLGFDSTPASNRSGAGSTGSSGAGRILSTAVAIFSSVGERHSTPVLIGRLSEQRLLGIPSAPFLELLRPPQALAAAA